MSAKQFIAILKALDLPDTFNPYADHCQLHDRADAAARRRRNLRALLEKAADSQLEALWLGRDLGYRGGRRTGMALTDDVHLGEHAARWGLVARKPTKGAAVKERTAQMIWAILSQIEQPVFLWNVFPLHPHERGKPFSNRRHSAAERDIGEQLLARLLELLQPQRLVAIGNDAAVSARRLFEQRRVVQVRHPSYGGLRDFNLALQRLYKLPAAPPRQR